MKVFPLLIYVFITLMLMGLSFFGGVMYSQSAGLARLSRETIIPTPQVSPPSTYVSNSPPLWEDKILYKKADVFSPEKTQAGLVLYSTDALGNNNKVHPVRCNGKPVTMYKSLVRKAGGRYIAFVLPHEDFRGNLKTFNEGVLHIFDLQTNTCESTGKTAWVAYGQSAAFSYDEQRIAYVSYGLHIYDRLTKQDKVLSSHERSAKTPTVIIGSPVWNMQGTAVYYAVATDSNYNGNIDTSWKTYLEKVSFLENIFTAEGGSYREEGSIIKPTIDHVADLADYYPEGLITKLYQKENDPYPTYYPDSPLLYGISPDEQAVVFEKNGNVIVKKNASDSETVIWKRTNPARDYTQRIASLVWVPSNWIIFETTQLAPGSSMGDIWGSKNMAEATKLTHGENVQFLYWYSFAYNTEYFGDYYIKQGEPIPTGFDTTGHKYDAIGLYQLDLGKLVETAFDIISGKDKPTGIVL